MNETLKDRIARHLKSGSMTVADLSRLTGHSTDSVRSACNRLAREGVARRVEARMHAPVTWVLAADPASAPVDPESVPETSELN